MGDDSRPLLFDGFAARVVAAVAADDARNVVPSPSNVRVKPASALARPPISLRARLFLSQIFPFDRPKCRVLARERVVANLGIVTADEIRTLLLACLLWW